MSGHERDDDFLALLDEVLAPAPCRAQADEGKPRILITDDSEDYRTILRYLLTGAGCEVLEAHDGRQALEMAIAEIPSLVILDFMMPVLNGYELLGELRSRADTRHIPVIVLTGAANRAQLREAMTGVSAFLEKPVRNGVLLEAVRRVVGNRVGAFGVDDQMLAEAEPDPLVVESILEVGEEKPDEAVGLEEIGDDSPVVAQINRLLAQAVQRGASDIHIEPFEKEVVVRYRVNGSLTRACTLPQSLNARFTARVKVMANLLLTERRRPQDGRIRAKVDGKKVEFRVSTLPSVFGEKIVLRVLGGVEVKERVDLLGFTPRDLECVEHALRSPHGLILVTGPTGSGKSTTLYTMIRAVSSPDVNVVTAEDPVEAELPGVTQTSVRPDLGVTFETLLRSFLRQDPDVMLVGEVRDLETAQISVKASITGHLVLSTLHTNSAPATALRLVHMGVPSFLVASSLRLIVAQRLVKRLCPSCKTPKAPSDLELKALGEAERAGAAGALWAPGCDSCHKTGCAGRQALFEVMPIRSPEMKKLLLDGRDPEALAGQAAAEGMKTLRAAALGLVAAGELSLAEAMKVCLGD